MYSSRQFQHEAGNIFSKNKNHLHVILHPIFFIIFQPYKK